jgi:hypothetical protein
LRSAKSRQAELTARLADARAVAAYPALAATAAASKAAAQSAADQVAALKTEASTTEQQIATSQQAASAAAAKANADGQAAEQAWSALVDRSTARFTLATLKPLSPEQLAWSTMQALGIVDAQVAALEPQAKKDADALANLADDARAAALARLVEERVDEKLRGHIGPFVSLFGQEPGQPPEFQATVHQALFLANGGLLAGWLKPGANNTSERLTKIEQPEAAAEALYLSLLCRKPTAEEQAQVAAFWEAGKADRAAAARDLVWSLVSSVEFRFNR